MEFPSRSGRREFLNLTPLIDVVFLMLVFFLLTSSFMRYNTVELRFVDTRTGAAGRSEALVIGLGSGGDLTVDGRLININELASLVARRLAEDPGLSGIVLPAEAVPLQLTLSVLERVREAGMTDVRIGGLAGDGL